MSKRLDFELNIVPIVDCLTILVTFMLAAGAFYTLAMLDVKVNAGAEVAVPATSPIELTVDLKLNHDLVFRVGGSSVLADNRMYSIRARDGKVDLAGLDVFLDQAKKKWEQVGSVTLAANKETPYQEVVTVLEEIKKTHPDVLLGGF